MSRGSRQRRAAAASGEQVGGVGRDQLWIFRPERARESQPQQQLADETRRLAQERNLLVKVRRVRRCEIAGGPDAHKRLDLVEPSDAGELYQVVHRSRVLVLALTASWVRGDPSRNPARKRQARKLEDFVRYKAMFGVVRGPGDPEGFIESFTGWPGPSDTCLAMGDPRVLPLHVFDLERPWRDLDTPSGSARFTAAHGQPARRTDRCGREWRPDPSRHGGEGLQVARLDLPVGFHWDVQCPRKSASLVTSHEVWKVHGHANVYPDAYVRLTRGSGKRVWPTNP